MGEKAEYGLVMPFVVCKSQGGDYDDEGFVAGYYCGALDAELAMCSRMPQGLAATSAPAALEDALSYLRDAIAADMREQIAREIEAVKPRARQLPDDVMAEKE